MEAAEFWAQIRDEREHISIEQINAFLNVCRICVAEGGWDIAWSNYQDSEAKFDKLPTPDIITYTIMLKMCAENGSSDGYSAAMRLWKTLIGRCSHETPHHAGKSQKASGSTPKSLSQSSLPIATFNPLLKGGLSIDEQVIAPLLLLAIRTPNMEEARAILPIVSQWFKLPIPLTNRHDLEQKRRGGPSLMERELRYSHTNSEANTSQKSPLVWAATPENISLSYPLEISTQTLDLLLRLANRVKEFQIGKEWFDILVNKRQVYTDSVAQTSLVTLLTQGGMYTDALNQASLLPRERSERERLKRLMTVDEATCRIAASARSAADAATTRATKSLPLFTKAVTGILKREGRWTCPEWKATTTDLTMLRNILFVLHQTNNNHQYTAPHNDLVRTVLQSTIPSILEYLKRVVGDRTRKMELYEEGRGGGGGEKKDKKGSTLVDHTPRRLLFEKGERRALMEYISMVQDGKWDKIRVKAEYKNSGVLLVLFELLVLSSQAINSTGVKQQQHIHHQQLKQQQQQQQYHQLLHGINKALAAFPDYLKSVSADEDTTDDGVKVIRKKIRK